jgi:GNAT superfamily N-acetyltransferase
MRHLLDNIFWNTLAGSHAKFSVGTEKARRFAPGFSPIVGFATPHEPDFAALRPFCQPGEHFYCDIWSGAPPSGWLWEAGMPADDAAPDAVTLRPEHFPQALALATLTNPGPFGIRTPELGEYFGYFEGDALIAMAGERMHAGSMREISGICTHPNFQGRGLARKLTLKLVRRQMQRGETPFLHVVSTNTGARALYEKLGFRNYLETVVRVISPI